MLGFSPLAATPLAAATTAAANGGVSAHQLPAAVLVLAAPPPGRGAGAHAAIPAAVLAWSSRPVAAAQRVHLPAAALAWSSRPVAAAQRVHLPAAALGLAAGAPEDMAYLRHRPHRRVWRLYLDGIELPMSSFQLRLRPSDLSYFSAVVPHALAYAETIAAHASGMLEIYQGYLYDDGAEDLALIATATLEGIDDARGPYSQSITLSGYGPGAPPGPPVEIAALEYRQSRAGTIRWRCEPTPQLRPGGVAVDPVSGERITAGLITWAVGMHGTRPCVLMEVAGG